MLGLAFLTLTFASQDDADLRKALEFQFEQKMEHLKKENDALRAEISRFQSKPAECEHIIIASKVKSPTQMRDDSAEKSVYRTALQEIHSERWDSAILAMEGFIRSYPESELADHALYWIAQIYIQKNELGLARAELERLIKTYPHGERAKRALARLQSMPLMADDRSTKRP